MDRGDCLRLLAICLMTLAVSPLASLSSSCAETTGPWFFEDVKTFKDAGDDGVTQDGRWSASDGVNPAPYKDVATADVEAGEIAVKAMGEKVLRYTPNEPGTNLSEVIVCKVRFGTPYKSVDKLPTAGKAGIVLVSDGYDGSVFAYLSNGKWFVTTVEGEPDDVLSIVMIFDHVNGTVTYGLGESADEFEPINYADVPLPEDSKLQRLSFRGVGGVEVLDAERTFDAIRPVRASLDAIDIRYGEDLNDATVSFEVVDFCNDLSDEIGVLAELVVWRADGTVVSVKHVDVTRNGAFLFEKIPFIEGAGRDYAYELVVYAYALSGWPAETVLSGATLASGAHNWRADWVNETAGTFPGVTGVWTSEGGEGLAVVEGDKILIQTQSYASSTDYVQFAANQEASNDVVRIFSKLSTDALFGGNVAYDFVAMGAHAVVAVVDDGRENIAFGLWNPSLSNGSGFVTLYGSGKDVRPALGREYEVRIDLNYRFGTVGVSIDGCALTNAEGRAFFPLPKSAVSAYCAKGVRFAGKGYVKTLKGELRNGNLAKVGDVEYRTVDEAARVAEKGDGKVDLLWNASWHPTVDQLGKTFSFVGGYKVRIDQSTIDTLSGQGCRVVYDERTHSYTVNAIDYTLTYKANDGVGEDQVQHFACTNDLCNFVLLSNMFTRVGSDFDRWNESPDGQGPLATNWTDGATVDLTPFGFTNITVYAQWVAAMRTITIVPPENDHVYVENVLTNGAIHSGVRYYEDRSATFGVRAGCPEIAIVFSTDIERKLDKDILTYQNVINDLTIREKDLPHVTNEVPRVMLPKMAMSEEQLWAQARNISFAKLAESMYVTSSRMLNMSKLLDPEKTVVRFSDFIVTEDGCEFRISIDGQDGFNVAALAEMILVSDDLNNWRPLSPNKIYVDGDVVKAVTDGKFLKVVIPRDD